MVLNMISNLSKKNERESAQFKSLQSTTGNQSKKFYPSSTQQTTPAVLKQKRKNFKNMFYSPNRDAFTEPHSKVHSVV